MVYGKRTPTIRTTQFKDFVHVHRLFMSALELGRLPPVDLIPALAWIPERLAPWKKFLKHIRSLHRALHESLLVPVEQRLESGKANGSFMEGIIEARFAHDLNRDHLL